jgi:hypothetical protein
MSLSRIKTWSVGETLSASDLNSEFNNILSNPSSLISPLTANLDAAFYTIKDGVYRNTVQTFVASDTTPSVAGGTVFKTANAAPTTITMFDSGVDGQFIYVLINDANTTIDFTGTNLKGNAGADWSPTTGDSLECFFVNPSWYCRISKNV